MHNMDTFLSVSFEMSSYPELYLHLKTLEFLGLVCCSCKKNQKGLLCIINKSDSKKTAIVFYLIQILCIIMMIYCILYIQEFHISVFTETGNHHSALIFGCGCAVSALYYAYFYLRRKKIIILINYILRYYNELTLGGVGRPFHRYYIISLAISVLNIVTSIINYTYGNLTLVACISYILLHSFVTILIVIVMSFYLSIVKIFEVLLKRINARLTDELMLPKPRKLTDILSQRNSILTICQNDLNHHFGFMILLTMGYIMIGAPSGPYLILSLVLTASTNGHMWYVIMQCSMVFLLSVPWVVVIITMSKCSCLTIEVINIL